jgi:hypothetical protein
MKLSETVACTLTEADHKTQRERWLALGTHLTARVETEDGLRLAFAYDPMVEGELRALVAVETECCSWAAWDVAREDDALVMAARSQGDGVATLHTMFTQLA